MPIYRNARAPLPYPASGQYFPTDSPSLSTTSAVLGNSTLRLVPWVVETPLTLDRLAIDVTAAGEASCKIRPGIYADNGNCYPGALLVDGGQLAADGIATPAATVSVTVSGLVWIGAVVQAAPSSQPTIRVNTNWQTPVPISSATLSDISSATLAGYSQASVTGALPANFTASVAVVGSAPRVIVRRA